MSDKNEYFSNGNAALKAILITTKSEVLKKKASLRFRCAKSSNIITKIGQNAVIFKSMEISRSLDSQTCMRKTNY
ncbi:MAG: hypothetical protein Q4C95_00045 [Planctomycetia bacterium]|nr:hypothetical protein [Planctomycetia bacterium]